MVGPNNELDFYWNSQGEYPVESPADADADAGAGIGYSRPAFVQRSIGESDVAAETWTYDQNAGTLYGDGRV